MLSKSILKYIQSLHHKKFRQEHEVFMAESPKVVGDLLRSAKFTCKMICALESYFTANTDLLLPLEEKTKLRITSAELQRISLLQTPNQVIAIFNKKPAAEIILKAKLNLLLDDIRDPGNLGTIIRLADWFGIENIICSYDCVENYNPKVVQASMGSLANVNIVYADLLKFINDNKETEVYAATLNGSLLAGFDKITEGLLLIGNESTGIDNELLKVATAQITIPRFGKAESLNAAVATGIILSHMVK